MNLGRLYNIDESRVAQYTQHKVVIPSYDESIGCCRLYLDHIPLENTLIIPDFVVEVSTETNPPKGTVYIDYREDYDYVMARGIVYFNAEDAGTVIDIHYNPVASRIDAEPINELINLHNFLSFSTVSDDYNVWRRTDLTGANAVENIIDWKTINGRPGLATASKDGLLSVEYFKKLSTMPDLLTYPAVGGVQIGANSDITILPKSWGDKITVESTDTINAYKTSGGNIAFSVNTDTLERPYSDIIAALRATSGTPSSTNSFVLNNDYRLNSSYQHEPLAHKHTADDILGHDLTPFIENTTTPDETKFVDGVTPPVVMGDDGTKSYVYEQSKSLSDDLEHRAWKYHFHTLDDITDINTLYNNAKFKGEKGDPGENGEPGKDGDPGKDGKDGGYYSPSINDSGVLSWTYYNADGTEGTSALDIQNTKVKGDDGITFIPTVDVLGNISWEAVDSNGNQIEYDIPATEVNIKGDTGYYYYPTVSDTGVISWEVLDSQGNTVYDANVPESISIKGQDGRDAVSEYDKNSSVLIEDFYNNWTLEGMEISSASTDSIVYTAGTIYSNNYKNEETDATTVEPTVDAALYSKTTQKPNAYALLAYTEGDIERSSFPENTSIELTIKAINADGIDFSIDDAHVEYLGENSYYSTSDKDDAAYYINGLEVLVSDDLSLYTVGDKFVFHINYTNSNRCMAVVYRGINYPPYITSIITSTNLTDTAKEYLLKSISGSGNYPLSLIYIKDNAITSIEDVQIRYPNYTLLDSITITEVKSFVKSDWKNGTLTIEAPNKVPVGFVYKLENGVWKSTMSSVSFDNTNITISDSTPYSGCIVVTTYK